MSEEKQRHWSHQKLRKFGSLTQEEYIDERLNQFREWYDKKATRVKKLYQWMRAATVIGGAIVPVLINLPVPKIELVTTLTSLMVVVFISLESEFLLGNNGKTIEQRNNYWPRDTSILSLLKAFIGTRKKMKLSFISLKEWKTLLHLKMSPH